MRLLQRKWTIKDQKLIRKTFVLFYTYLFHSEIGTFSLTFSDNFSIQLTFQLTKHFPQLDVHQMN